MWSAPVDISLFSPSGENLLQGHDQIDFVWMKPMSVLYSKMEELKDSSHILEYKTVQFDLAVVV